MGEGEAIWLVRSGHRILGPLSTADIKSGLRARDILPHDEIASPFSRWRLAMYQPEFQEAIAQLSEAAQIESTHSSSVNTAATERTSKTNNTSNSISRTKTISNFSQGPVNEGMVTDVYVDEESTYVFSGNQEKIKAPESDYAFVSEQVVTERVRDQSQGIWIITIVICIFLVASVAYFKFLQRTSDASAKFDDLLRQGILAKIHGENAKAVAIFRDLDPEHTENPDLLYHYGPLAITFEKQSLLGRRLMERLLSIDFSGQYYVGAHTGIGLSGIFDGDLGLSSQHLKEAMLRDPSFYPATFNQGVVEYKLKNYVEAIKLFQEAQRISVSQSTWRDGSAAIMEGLAAYRQHVKESSKVSVETSLEHLRKYVKMRNADIAEAFLVESWLLFVLERPKEAKASLLRLVNSTPGISKYYVHDPLIFREHLSWSAMLEYCLKLTEKLGKDADMAAVKAICLTQAGRNIEAVKTLEYGESVSPGNGLVKSVQAYVFYSMGKSGEARGALRSTKKQGAPILHNYVSGQVCFESGDFRCAEEHFSALLAQQPTSVIAITRLAEIKVAMGEKAEALDYIAQTYEQGRDFGPLLRLRYELGRR
jgi:tetratricopeptide (TPR) repeat protein